MGLELRVGLDGQVLAGGEVLQAVAAARRHRVSVDTVGGLHLPQRVGTDPLERLVPGWG